MASDRLTSNKTEKVGRKCDKKSRQIRKWRRREDGSKDGKAERLLVSFYDAESDHVFFLSFFTVFIAFTRISERFFYLKKKRRSSDDAPCSLFRRDEWLEGLEVN